jgi:hypothetical protein
VQFILASGLLDAGYEALARKIAERTVLLAENEGLGDALAPFRFDPWTGKALRIQDAYKAGEIDLRANLFRSEKREQKTAVNWTCSGASGILGLVNILADDSASSPCLG